MAIIGLSFTDPTFLLTVAVDRTSFALWHVAFAGTPAHIAALRRFLDSTPEPLLPVVMVKGVAELATMRNRTTALAERFPHSVIVFDSPDVLAAAGFPVLDAEEVEEGRWEEKSVDIEALNSALATTTSPEALEEAEEEAPMSAESESADGFPEENEYGPRFVRRKRRGGAAADARGLQNVRVLEAGETYDLTAPVFPPLDAEPEPEGCPCDLTDEPEGLFAAPPGTLGHLVHAAVHDMADVPDSVVAALVEWAIGMIDAAEYVRRGRGPALRLGAPEDALAALGWWRSTPVGEVTAFYAGNADLIASCPDPVIQDVEMVLALIEPRRRRWAKSPQLPAEHPAL